MARVLLDYQPGLQEYKQFIVATMYDLCSDKMRRALLQVIDGQQRLTTVCVILAALRCLF